MKTGGAPEPVAKSKPTPGELQIKPVFFKPESAWQAAKFKQAVYASDNFLTKRGSRLKIKSNDNSLLVLGPNSRMSIDSYQLKRPKSSEKE